MKILHLFLEFLLFGSVDAISSTLVLHAKRVEIQCLS